MAALLTSQVIVIADSTVVTGVLSVDVTSDIRTDSRILTGDTDPTITTTGVHYRIRINDMILPAGRSALQPGIPRLTVIRADDTPRRGVAFETPTIHQFPLVARYGGIVGRTTTVDPGGLIRTITASPAESWTAAGADSYQVAGWGIDIVRTVEI